MMKLLRSTCLLAAAALINGCASGPEPTKEPPLGPPDTLELFHRARFRELVENDPNRIEKLEPSLASPGASNVESFSDWLARTAYREGDGRAAKEALAMLGSENRTRKILEALFEHVDTRRPLRLSHAPERTVELALSAIALDRGYPVVEAEIRGKTVRLLWDTGAPENILSPEAADLLELSRTEVQLLMMRKDDGLVLRFAATGTNEVAVGPWRVSNVPWLVAELDTIKRGEGDVLEASEVDGILSPQLLLHGGCFAIDRNRALLRVAFDGESCRAMMTGTVNRVPLFNWDGEIYTSARVHESPELAVQLETGSPVSFLRTHATRYLPQGLVVQDSETRGAEIAHGLRQTVTIQVAGRAKSVSAIDLAPPREARAYDDIATLGNDVLLQGGGVVINFATREIGMLGRDPQPAAAGAPIAEAKAKPEKSSGSGARRGLGR